MRPEGEVGCRKVEDGDRDGKEEDREDGKEEGR